MTSKKMGLGETGSSTLSNAGQQLLFRLDKEHLLARQPELIADSGGVTALHRAANAGDLEEARRLLRAGADVHSRDVSGQETAVHRAARSGVSDLLRTLVRAGASVNEVNGAGDTPLLVATQQGHAAAAHTLLKAGANPSLSGRPDGETALLLACGRGDVELVTRLIAYRASPDQTGRDGETPLQRMAADGRTEILEMLLRKGAQPDLAPSTSSGAPPLVLAAQLGYGDMVHALLRANASVDHANSHGETALFAARQRGFTKVAHELLLHGADPDALPDQGPLRARGCGRARPGGLGFGLKGGAQLASPALPVS